MRGEPVRGGLPDPGFYSLAGFEQVEAIRRGLVPRSPLAHLIGLAVTQAGPGRATLTAPASPWLEWGDGPPQGCVVPGTDSPQKWVRNGPRTDRGEPPVSTGTDALLRA